MSRTPPGQVRAQRATTVPCPLAAHGVVTVTPESVKGVGASGSIVWEYTYKGRCAVCGVLVTWVAPAPFV